jgi:hypothetical protein
VQDRYVRAAIHAVLILVDDGGTVIPPHRALICQRIAMDSGAITVFDGSQELETEHYRPRQVINGTSYKLVIGECAGWDTDSRVCGQTT